MLEFISSSVCNGNEHEKSLHTKTVVFDSNVFPAKNGYSDNFCNCVESLIVTLKEFGKYFINRDLQISEFS